MKTQDSVSHAIHKKAMGISLGKKRWMAKGERLSSQSINIELILAIYDNILATQYFKLRK